MKIALIGNMNNANFAIMRYFRDMGADAHLLLYANDGQRSLSHFKPESDTWNMERWQPYIHQTSIPNALVTALEFPYSWLMASRSMFRSWLALQDGWAHPISKALIHRTYREYDRLMASGITPATLARADLSLDLFFPYSTGVEFLRSGEFVQRFDGMLGINRLVGEHIARLQSAGIRAAKHVLNAEMGLTHDVLIDIGVEPIKLAIPAVYVEENMPEAPPSKVLLDAIKVIVDSSFTILHQARLFWTNPGHYLPEAWIKEDKHNDWLVRSFASLIKERPELKPRLLIVEYGTDVETTKQLITELGINAYVHWLPKMDRRELMWLLSRVDIGVGEFYDVPRLLWGGTGWEALASGKPLLQGFNFAVGEYEQIFGHPPPPILPVRTRDDILRHLLDMADHPEKVEVIGRDAKTWFNRYNGVSLARLWLDLLQAADRDIS